MNVLGSLQTKYLRLSVVLQRLSKLRADEKTIDGNVLELWNGRLLPLKQEVGVVLVSPVPV